MYQAKKNDVLNVKDQLEQNRRRLEYEQQMKMAVNKQRHQGIKDQYAISSNKYKEYIHTKQNRLKDQFKSRVDEEK